jgi:hypothetical protein
MATHQLAQLDQSPNQLETTPDAVDTFLVASNIKVPFCSWGDNITPQVKIIVDTRVSNSEVKRRIQSYSSFGLYHLQTARGLTSIHHLQKHAI